MKSNQAGCYEINFEKPGLKLHLRRMTSVAQQACLCTHTHKNCIHYVSLRCATHLQRHDTKSFMSCSKRVHGMGKWTLMACIRNTVDPTAGQLIEM